VHLQSIIALLPKLSLDELEQLRQRCSALISLSSGAILQDQSSDAHWVIGCVVQHNRSHGRDLTPVATLQKNPGTGFHKSLPALLQYLEQGAGKQRLHKQALLMLGLELLSQNLEEIRIPVTSRILLRYLPRLPSVINRAFPGYWQSGLLPWVLSMQRPTAVKQTNGADPA
jgi:hypothetical protein